MLRLALLAALFPAFACGAHIQVAAPLKAKVERVSMTLEAAPEVEIAPELVALIRGTFTEELTSAGIKLERDADVRLVGHITRIANGGSAGHYYNGDEAGLEHVEIAWTINCPQGSPMGKLRTETSAFAIPFGNSLHLETKATAREMASYLVTAHSR